MTGKAATRPSAANSLNSNSLISGRFEVHDFINQGGMGAVYRGIDRKTGQTVAIKHLKKEVVNADPGLVERFVREGEALRTLEHPNIVRMISAEKQDSGHYLVMEYVPGGSLADLINRERKIPIARVMQVAIELSDALARAHYMKIIHRDLKPANVLLTSSGSPRLTDFGVARVGDSQMTGTGALIGTFAYLAPEVMNGEHADARSDIWAFGVMLFEMLSGERPFDGPTPGAQVAAIMTRPAPDLEALRPDAPIGLVDLIYRMLEKERAQRIGSMRLVGAELEVILNGGLSTGRTPRPNSAPPTMIPAVPITSTPTPSRPAHHLPVQTTPFVGREVELAEIETLLGDPAIRLVTILGPGGTGKTRLSIEAASRVQVTYGACFVALAGCTAPEMIVNVIADTLQFQFNRGVDAPIVQLRDYLREKHLLLVMDNFEHLITGAPLLDSLLSAAPGLKILVTSRERLNLGGETVFRIDGMDFPADENAANIAQYSAVQLFIQGARRAVPSYNLSRDDAPHIARITRQVQGMPLGVLLAASWVEILSIPEIASEIEKSLDFLETEQRDVPERQRSIRAVFDYSWNLLTLEEQSTFARLSVFRGGFTRDAAQETTGANLRTLMALVNKSLLRRTPSGRYEIHELLRQYAEARLQDDPAAYAAALDSQMHYYAGFLDERNPRALALKGPKQPEMLRFLRSESGNLVAAWKRLVDTRQAETLGNCIENMWLFAYIGERQVMGEQVFRYVREAFAAAQPTNDLDLAQAYGFCLSAEAFFRACNGSRRGVRKDFERAEAILRALPPNPSLAYLLLTRGILVVTTNDTLDYSYEQLALVVEEAHHLLKEFGDDWSHGLCHFLLSMMYRNIGRLEEALTEANTAMDYARRIGDANLEAFARLSLGGHAWSQGEYLEAKAHFGALITMDDERVPREAIGHGRINYAFIIINMGEFDEARQSIDKAVAYFQETGNRSGLMRATSARGWVAEAEGDSDQARRWFTEATKIARETENKTWIANELDNLARPAVRLGHLDEAKAYLNEALLLATESNGTMNVLTSITWLAYILGKQGNPARAVELLSYSAAQPNAMEARRDAEAALAEFQTDMPANEFEAAFTRGQMLRLETVLSEFQKNR